ncbi:unnamed protein product [Macrosiphum euphorbiae]|uniref:Uncharacterized protein n=1 Tax=Macrosiphum euphorbiae TaxID=13131 RepID=A0AAV0VW47_9HEMI|nr:unnamed protein product [Macrosiphum euphorbiae]
MSKDGSSADFAHRLVFSHSLVYLIVSPGASVDTVVRESRLEPWKPIICPRPLHDISIAPLDFREFPTSEQYKIWHTRCD